MAVSRREKASDAKYSSAIGTRPSSSNREFEIEDVIEDLRDDMNAMCDLSAANEAKTSFPGFGTTSTKALRGNTTTITPTQAAEITANTAKIGQKFQFYQTTASSTAVSNTAGRLFLGAASPYIVGSHFASALSSAGVEFSNLEAGYYKVTLGLDFDSTRPQNMRIDFFIGNTRVFDYTIQIATQKGQVTLFTILRVSNTNVSNSDKLTFRTLGNTAGQSVTFNKSSYVLLEKV